MTTQPFALSITGSDASGVAGIQADLRAFAAAGVYTAPGLTSLTAQHPVEVTEVMGSNASFVKSQLDTVFLGLPVYAMKTAMHKMRSGWLDDSGNRKGVIP